MVHKRVCFYGDYTTCGVKKLCFYLDELNGVNE